MEIYSENQMIVIINLYINLYINFLMIPYKNFITTNQCNIQNMDLNYIYIIAIFDDNYFYNYLYYLYMYYH